MAQRSKGYMLIGVAGIADMIEGSILLQYFFWLPYAQQLIGVRGKIIALE